MAAPKRVAKVTPRRLSLPIVRTIACLETTVCTIAEIAKPRGSGQRTSQNMKKAIWSAWPRSLSTNTLAMPSRAAEGGDAVTVGRVVRGPPCLEPGGGDGGKGVRGVGERQARRLI